MIVQNPALTPWQIEHIRKMKEGLGMPQAASNTEEVTMDPEEPTGALNSVTDTPNEGADATSSAPAGALPSSTISTIRDKMAQYTDLGKKQQDFYERMAKRLETERVGPSFSERMYQLSAAFAAPTTTRGFGGVMGNIMPVLQKQQEERRVGEIKRKEALEALAGQQLAAKKELLGQELTTELKLGELERKANAPRMPKVVGTETVNGKIVVITQDPDTNEIGKTEIGEAPQGLKLVPGAVSNGQPVFQDASGNFMTADRQPVSAFDEKPKKLSATEQRQIFDIENDLGTYSSGIGMVQQALQYNNAAYDGSLAGWRKSIGQLFSSDSPEYQATEQYENLVKTAGAGGLKSMFGGNPTEGERAVYFELLASLNKGRAVRETILRRTLAELQKKAKRDAGRLTDLKSGGYSTVTPRPSGKPRVINWNK